MSHYKIKETIEEMHLQHFEFFPKHTGCRNYIQDGAHIINCGLGSSMFNIVYGVLSAASSSAYWEEKIRDIIGSFKAQPFAWWIPPSQKNPAFTKALTQAGFIMETTEHAMLCNLDNITSFQPKTDLIMTRVLDATTLDDFITVLEPYDSTARLFYEKVSPALLALSEKLFVGYSGNKPVATAIPALNKN